MNREKLETLIQHSLNHEEFCDYLTAPYGHKLGIYSDGSINVGENIGNEIADDEKPVAWIDCPGNGNVDFSDYLDYPQEEDTYINPQGLRFDNFDDALEDALNYADLSEDYELITDRLLDCFDEFDRYEKEQEERKEAFNIV